MAKRLIKKSIRGQLIRVFIWAILLPLYVFTFGVLIYSRSSILNQAENSGRANLSQIAYDISNMFNEYKYLSQFIEADNQITQVQYYNDANEFNNKPDQIANISQLLRGYKEYISGIEMISIAFSNNIVYSTDTNSAVDVDLSRYDWFVNTVQGNQNADLISYAPGELPFIFVKERLTETILQLYPISNENGDRVGVITILIYNQVFEKAIHNNLGDDGSFIYITDSNENVVYSPVIQNIPGVANNSDYIMISENISGTDWKLNGMVHVGDINKQIINLAEVVLMSLLIISLMMLIFAVKTGVAIVHPIDDLKKLARKIEIGDFSGRFDLVGDKNEIYDLGKAFNTMSINLDKLMKQVLVEQKLKKEAELEVLQANVKPHFLYNTLDTVSWMARKYKANEIVDTVDSLSAFFRVSLSKGSNLILLEQEILHVESYLKIQKTRYEDMLNYSFEIDNKCKSFYVEKIILQPLVENAIYHGIKERGSPGNVKVKVEMDSDNNCLLMTIKDDGVGMSQNRLATVVESLHKNNYKSDNCYLGKDDIRPYGITNVHLRLRLNFGEYYGLNVSSKLGEGTVILIKHPIISGKIKSD